MIDMSIAFIRLHTGPQFSYINRATSEIILGETSEKINIEDLINKEDFSWVAGGELVLPGGLRVGARYIIGMTDTNTSISSNSTSKKHRVIQLSLLKSFF